MFRGSKTVLVLFSVACIVAVIGIAFVINNPLVEKETITSVDNYEKYLGKNGKYKNNYVAYNSIWPNKLTGRIKVKSFFYEYYNPWDANYLGYMTINYLDPEDYKEEITRLSLINSTEYIDVYGIKSFSKDLCAIFANEYGIIYALSDIRKQEIVYVSIEFCNYFTDIDYKDIIDEDDLPTGLDISEENPTRKFFESSGQ